MTLRVPALAALALSTLALASLGSPGAPPQLQAGASLATNVTGSLVVVVQDELGQRVPGAIVSVFAAGSPDVVASLPTDADGTLVVTGLEPGRYEVSAVQVVEGSFPPFSFPYAVIGKAKAAVTGGVRQGVLITVDAPLWSA